MDADWVPVIVSAITGAFGLAGVVAAQWLAKNRAKKLKPLEKNLIEVSGGFENGCRQDYLLEIRNMTRDQGHESRNSHHEITALLRDMRYEMRQGLSDLRHDIERLER